MDDIPVKNSSKNLRASNFFSLSRPLPCSSRTTVSTCASSAKLALHTLGQVLRNSFLYMGVGWFSSYCFTLGNIFTSVPPSQQSHAEFSAANTSWFWGVFSACMIIIVSARLLPEQFVGLPLKQLASVGPVMSVTRRLTWLQCIHKLLVPMTPHLVLGATGAIGGDFFVYSIMPVSWTKFKPILYIAAFWGFYTMIMADVYARRIFQMETVRGIVASGLRVYSEKQRSSVTTRKTTRKIRPLADQKKPQRCWIPSPYRILRVFRQNLPVVVMVLIAVVYVHALSQFLHYTGPWGIFAFACASIALKLMLQELAKRIMLSVRRPVSRRVMVAFVSTPTILVDTQVRMLLLRQDSLNVSVVGTVLLAAFEIMVRAVKSRIVHRQTCQPITGRIISQRRSLSTNPLPALRILSGRNVKPTHVLPMRITTDATKNGDATRSRAYSMSGEASVEYKARRDAEERRRKIRLLHAGEIYADMYAEYIAIGCSHAILFFYRSHPQYEFSLLLSASADQEDGSTEVFQGDQQLLSLGILQMSVEVVVDFLACVLEASQGVELTTFSQNDPFLIFFLAMLTFSNVAISAGMYMR